MIESASETREVVRYLRSPMYISLHQDSCSRSASVNSVLCEGRDLSSRSDHIINDVEGFFSRRALTNVNTFLPNIGSSKSGDRLEAIYHHPAYFNRQKSFSDNYTSLKSAHLCTRNFPSINYQSQRKQSFGGVSRHSAPVRTKTFEDTLLPTHNIFFAGRPSTPKFKVLQVEIEKAPATEIPDVSAILRRPKQQRRNRRVTFEDTSLENLASAGQGKKLNASLQGKEKRSSSQRSKGKTTS
ncbi:uncharacterized protein [Watersipora subatra]|uniref:uncharacterized protein n=1 Tax=Watersipora subatra TaxID=2589382 RepID=UPI00355B1FD9